MEYLQHSSDTWLPTPSFVNKIKGIFQRSNEDKREADSAPQINQAKDKLHEEDHPEIKRIRHERLIEKNISIAIHKALWFQSANVRYIHELISLTNDFFKSPVTVHPYGRVYYRGKLTKDASVNKPEAQQNFDLTSPIPLHERGWYCNIPKMYNWPSLWGMAI